MTIQIRDEWPDPLPFNEWAKAFPKEAMTLKERIGADKYAKLADSQQIKKVTA